MGELRIRSATRDDMFAVAEMTKVIFVYNIITCFKKCSVYVENSLIAGARNHSEDEKWTTN